MNRYLRILTISFALGLVVAMISMVIAFQHNSQGELVDLGTGKVDIPYALRLFVSWFLLSSIVIGAIVAVIILIVGILNKRLKGD